MAMPVVRLTLFTARNCSLCDGMKVVLQRLRQRVPFELSEVDINAVGSEQWRRQYRYDIPVLHLNDQLLVKHRIYDEAHVLKCLREASDVHDDTA